jgi:hypothetical protein
VDIYTRQVETVARAVAFQSLTSFSWFGRRSDVLRSDVRLALGQKAARSYLVSRLQDHLYFNFYCRGVASPLKTEVNQGTNGLRASFLEELSKANAGSGSQNGKWEVRALEGPQIVVSDGQLVLWVLREDCLVSRNSRVEPGSYIRLRLPKEYPNLSPGFYLATSNTDFKSDDWQQALRIYWNVLPSGALPLMSLLTTNLNQMNVPFRLKVQKDFSQLPRCDSAVLYIRKRDYHRVGETLEKAYLEVKEHLRQGTPGFTKPLTGEVGLAEEPLPATSFGLNRCLLLAEGLVSAYEQGEKSLDGRMAVIKSRFAENGISLDRPFLNPGSDDIYQFSGQLQKSRVKNKKAVAKINGNVELFLQTAHAIGVRLCQEAFWFQDRCNWMGSSMKDLNNRIYSSLGGELYSGTCGVGLFLAELYAATADPVMKRTALGAIRHAFSSVEDIVPSLRLGAYSGWVGIALAATRMGIVLENEELLECAKRLLQRTSVERHVNGELDLISGNAGALTALIALADVLDDKSLFDLSIELGQELLERAVASVDGYSWKTTNAANEHNLTGFSHGAAGIGYALLELFHATGDRKYCAAARMAYQYEHAWFSADVRNWPDLRHVSVHSKRSKHTFPFSTVWCHGAPGIALSRLRAYEILKEDKYKREALSALLTTRAMIDSDLYSRRLNFSLCHGLAGNAEVLLIGSYMLGTEFSTGHNTALEVGLAGAHMHGPQAKEWPCGAGAGSNPSLMLGLAGIGYFYLRLRNPTIPSMLLLERESLKRRAVDRVLVLANSTSPSCTSHDAAH